MRLAMSVEGPRGTSALSIAVPPNQTASPQPPSAERAASALRCSPQRHGGMTVPSTLAPPRTRQPQVLSSRLPPLHRRVKALRNHCSFHLGDTSNQTAKPQARELAAPASPPSGEDLAESLLFPPWSHLKPGSQSSSPNSRRPLHNLQVKVLRNDCSFHLGDTSNQTAKPQTRELAAPTPPPSGEDLAE
jgi:hypothetical protein